jgi:hypothetical protein
VKAYPANAKIAQKARPNTCQNSGQKNDVFPDIEETLAKVGFKHLAADMANVHRLEGRRFA